MGKVGLEPISHPKRFLQGGQYRVLKCNKATAALTDKVVVVALICPVVVDPALSQVRLCHQFQIL